MTDTATSLIEARRAQGQFFNTYELQGGGYAIGIGPVTDFLRFAGTASAEAADFIVDALRKAHGQPETLCPCVDTVATCGGQ